MPYRKFARNYIICIMLINSINTVMSLGMEEYCDRRSPIYDVRRDAGSVKRLIA